MQLGCEITEHMTDRHHPKNHSKLIREELLDNWYNSVHL